VGNALIEINRIAKHARSVVVFFINIRKTAKIELSQGGSHVITTRDLKALCL